MLAVPVFEFGDAETVSIQTPFPNPLATQLVDRFWNALYSVTGVNAEHRLVARFFPLENTGAPFAFSMLTFLRYGREHFRRIEFVKLVDQDAIRDRLGQRFEDGGVDGSDYGSTFVALKRYLLPVQFRHDAAYAIDASAPMRYDGEVERFVGHHFIVAPRRMQGIEQGAGGRKRTE
jgi:hypothetical protein